MALAQADLTGWYIGWGIGIPVILVVAALVLGIIATAYGIASIAADGTESLAEARDRSEALWQIKTTNRVAADIIDGAKQARKALGG